MKERLCSYPDRIKLFKNTVFGQWLNIKTYEHDNHLLHYLLQHQRFVENPNINTPFYFDLWGHNLEFGREDMCLILGFRFGDVSLEHLRKRQSSFGKRMLKFLQERRTEKITSIKAEHLCRIVCDTVEFDELSNDDAVRVCLIVFLENVFMGKQERNLVPNEILVLVDDFYAWNAFPWGEYIWVEFHKKIYNAVAKVRDRHLVEFSSKGERYTATYTLCGFAFALKIWLLESFNNSSFWWTKEENVIPRGVAWADGHRFEKTDYDLLFRNTQMVRLVPTDTELNELWWSSSVDFFRKYNHITPSPAIDAPASIDTPAANTSCRPAKLTPRRRSGMPVSRDVDRGVRKDMPPTSTIMAQMTNMQLQISGLHKYLKQLKPDRVSHIPIIDEELPANVTVSTKMSHMQRQIDELHTYIKNLSRDGCSSDTAPECNEKSSGIDAMDVDVDQDVEVRENIIGSSCNDLSTQEVQEVMHDVFVSPKDPTVYQDVCGDEQVINEPETKDSPFNQVGGMDVEVNEDVVVPSEVDAVAEVNGEISEEKNIQSPNMVGSMDVEFHEDVVVNGEVDAVAGVNGEISDEKNLQVYEDVEVNGGHEKNIQSPNMVDNFGKVDEGVALNGNMSETQNPESPFNPDVLTFDDDEHSSPMDLTLQSDASPLNSTPADVKHFEPDRKDGLIFFDEEVVSPVDVKLDSEYSPLNSTPVEVKYSESVYGEDAKVTTVRVPFQRERKVSKVYQSPYMQQPSTVPRRRTKRHLKAILPKVTGPDGKEICLKPWKENLRRNGLGTMFKAFVHPEIQLFLDAQKKLKMLRKPEQCFVFPWGNACTTANLQFWLGLLGRDEGNRGWLGDTHIGLWVDFLMHFRPAGADWVMISPFFATMILALQMPLYYADGVTNGIPWFREGVEKVFFPINQPDTHWVLGELEIKTGVITIYDSLGGNTSEEYVEKRSWWINFRSVFSRQLPQYLVESEVMEMKNLDPNNYNVTFKYAHDVPQQGGKYGDCGIWVCIFLYRLSHNLPLKVKNPVQAALAYREHLADFYWKYKIAVPNECVFF